MASFRRKLNWQAKAPPRFSFVGRALAPAGGQASLPDLADSLPG